MWICSLFWFQFLFEVSMFRRWYYVFNLLSFFNNRLIYDKTVAHAIFILVTFFPSSIPSQVLPSQFSCVSYRRCWQIDNFVQSSSQQQNTERRLRIPGYYPGNESYGRFAAVCLSIISVSVDRRRGFFKKNVLFPSIFRCSNLGINNFFLIYFLSL